MGEKLMAIMNNMKFNQLCLIALTIAVCIQRLSIAAGNILYALSILFFIIDTYRRYQSGEKLFLTEQVKKYFLVYVFFALTILPSAIFSLDMGYSSSKFLDYFVSRFLVFFMLIFLKIDTEAIKKALLCFIAFMAIDGIATLVERLITQAPRVNGLGDGLLRHASIVATVFPASIILWISRSKDIQHKNYLLFCAICIVLGAIASGTRSSWVGILAVMPFVLYQSAKWSPKKCLVLVAVFACTAGVIAATPQLNQRAASIVNITTDRSNGDRVEAWKGAAVMIKEKPVIGYGILQGGKVYLRDYRTAADTQGLGHFHNIYVQTAVDSGLLGLAGLLTFMAYSLWLFRRWDSPYSMIGFCAWIGFAVVGFFDYTWGMSAAVKTLWFVTGCSLRLYEDT
ncbi:O-antigen ligase family protein [Mitsuokella multacida]|uniref:O-antigen ligase family protein n=1 Tax=Mitsuokella multacida TaxID=52226 RepID=UPI0026DEE53C|nr:O-antigen ligase family protein [Mitsuokella multacida]